MASCLSDLGKIITEKLMNWTIAESRYIVCFTCIVEEFEKEQKALKAEKLTLEARVEVAKKQVNWDPPNVAFWLEEASKLIQEDTKTNLACFFGSCPNCKLRYSKGKELANKTDEIRRLMQRHFDSVGLPIHLPGVEYHSSQHYISFKSRELKCKELLDALKDDNIYIIGLQGMGGTGKTTLAKQVGKELKQCGQFDLVIDTTVSNTPDVKKIQDDIAAPLGLKLDNHNGSERPKVLWSRLTNGEKILVILDDVWGHINFEEIGIPCSDNHKGCRVLVTTRDLWVCNSLGCEKTIQLEFLSDEDGWMLFQKHAGIKAHFPKRLLEKGHEIVKRCKGLPVAIAAIASSLKGQQRKEEWDAALISLKKPMSLHGVDENLVQVYKCLRHSYDRLNNEGAKGLFLLCSMFPEDAIIATETLTRFGISVGLFGEVDGKYDEARCQVVVAKNKLVDSCLLLEDGEGYVKMHDLVRDVAHWIGNKKILTVNMSNKNHRSMVEREKNSEYLLCKGIGKDVFSCRVNSSQLKLLIVNLDKDADLDRDNPVEIPNSFFENMTRLKVFHVSSGTFREDAALSLPQSIQSLTTILSLTLDRFTLGDISVLGNLRSLETLELIDCDLVALPQEIVELVNLRLLNLKWCQFESNNPFEVIERCKSLEELYFVGNIETPKNITLPTLHRYRICQNSVMVIYSSASNYVGVKEIDVFFSETTFKYLVQNAKILYLTRIKGAWRNLIPEIVSIDEGMTDVVHLTLSSCTQMKCLIDITSRHINLDALNIFPKLVELALVKMENLEELCNGSAPVDLLKSLGRLIIVECEHLQGMLFKSKLNLCNLKTMKLHNCQKLESLFRVPTSRSLVLLEELIIKDCEQLKNIITKEGHEGDSGEEITDDDNDKKSHGSMFPKLRKLSISNCSQLEVGFPFLSTNDVPLLEIIKIDDCYKMKFIFGQCQHEHNGRGLHHELKDDVILGSLRKIVLCGSPKFIDVFQECNHPMCSSVRRLPSRHDSKTQIQLDTGKNTIFPGTLICCYGHRNKHKFKSTTTSNDIPPVSKDQLQDSTISLALKNSNYVHFPEHAKCLSRQWHMLCNIKKIYISRVPELKFMFILSTAPTMLLEILTVEDCAELKHIIVDMGNDQSENKWSNVFPKLKELTVRDCEELEYVFGEYPPHSQSYVDVENNSGSNLQIIHIQLPALTCLKFVRLHKLIGFCSASYRTTVPLLREVQLDECHLFIAETPVDPNSRQLDSTSIKGFGGNGSNFLSLEDIMVPHSNAENILFVGVSFVAPKNSYTLQNLKELTIEGSQKLEAIFSTSAATYLPQLDCLKIGKCKELKHIVIDDCDQLQTIVTDEKEEEVGREMVSGDNNNKSRDSMFPKLRTLQISKCPKLEIILPLISAQGLPLLEVTTIRDCDKLKYIFGCTENKWSNVLPKLRCLDVSNCGELEYVFGEYPPHSQRHPHPHDDVENNSSNLQIIHIQLPALTWLEFVRLQKLIGFCSASYCTTVPHLSNVRLQECPEFTIKSIKDLSGNMNNFLAMGSLNVRNSKAENIVCLDEVIGQQIDLRIRSIDLRDLPHMIYLFMGPQNSFILQNLKTLEIERCEKLKVIFPACVARCLPQLDRLTIKECKELKQIIVEEDVENQKTLCFPKLKLLEVTKCNSLKCVFSVSTSIELPKLKVLYIKEALELEEVFRFENGADEQKVELPNLNAAILMELPSLCAVIESQTPPRLLAHKCPKLMSSTSTLTVDELEQDAEEASRKRDWERSKILKSVIEYFKEFETQDSLNKNSSVEICEEAPVESEVRGKSGLELSSSLVNSKSNDVELKELISTYTEHAVAEDKTHVPEVEMDGLSKALMANKTYELAEAEGYKPTGHDTNIENPIVEITQHFPVGLQVQTTYEPEGPKPLDIPLALHKTNSHEDIDASHSHETSVVPTAETCASVSSIDDASMKASSIDKEQFSSNDNKGVTESVKSTPTIPSPFASQPLSVPFKVSELNRGPFPNPPDVLPYKKNSQEFLDEQSKREPCLINKQQREIAIAFENPQGNKFLRVSEDRNIEEGPKSEIKNISSRPCPAPLQKDIKKNIEEVTIANAKIITSSTHSEPLSSSSASTLVSSQQETYSQGDGYGQIATPSFRVIAAENPTIKDVDVSHSQETSMLPVSMAETYAPESKSSPTIQSHVASHTPSMPLKGNTSQIVEDLSFASLITRELEQLVSNKHLAYENLSLLTDFLMKHPSFRLIDNAHSNKYKGFAYSCLVEFLKFLQTHSVLDVLGSSHSKFVELLQDVRGFAFDKNWLDDVERRALHPGLQVSKDALQKVLESKQQATKEVEGLSLKIEILTQHVEDLKHQLAFSKAALENIIQHEAQIMEAWATLNTPLGY